MSNELKKKLDDLTKAIDEMVSGLSENVLNGIDDEDEDDSDSEDHVEMMREELSRSATITAEQLIDIFSVECTKVYKAFNGSGVPNIFIHTLLPMFSANVTRKVMNKYGKKEGEKK